MGTALGRQRRLIPVAPLLAAVERERAKGARTYAEIASDCGIAEKRITEWRSGATTAVEPQTADKVMLALGLNWFDAYDEDVYPEAYARAEELFG